LSSPRDVGEIEGKYRDEYFLADTPKEAQEADIENVSRSLFHFAAIP
jgi:hypothetical protein